MTDFILHGLTACVLTPSCSRRCGRSLMADRHIKSFVHPAFWMQASSREMTLFHMAFYGMRQLALLQPSLRAFADGRSHIKASSIPLNGKHLTRDGLLFACLDRLVIVFIQVFVTDTLELCSGHVTQQLPSRSPVFPRWDGWSVALGYVFFSRMRLQNFAYILSTSLRASPRMDMSSYLFASRISGKQLVHGVCVVFSCLALTNTFILQTDRDGSTSMGGLHLTVQLTGKNDLSLCDVSGQVRDGWSCHPQAWSGSGSW